MSFPSSSENIYSPASTPVLVDASQPVVEDSEQIDLVSIVQIIRFFIQNNICASRRFQERKRERRRQKLRVAYQGQDRGYVSYLRWFNAYTVYKCTANRKGERKGKGDGRLGAWR